MIGSRTGEGLCPNPFLFLRSKLTSLASRGERARSA